MNPKEAKSQTRLLIACCSLLAVAGVIGPGPFRWVLLAICAVLGLVLAIRMIRNEDP